MLKEIRALWKDGSLMLDVLQKLGQMVSDVEYVYSRGWEVCIGQAVVEKTEGPLRERDKGVNQTERDIRRMIVEHLTVNPGKDVAGCLAVMLMAKDVERVGDDGRNIFHVGVTVNGTVAGFKLFDRLDDVQKGVGRLLPKLQLAILESSEQVAHEVLAQYQELKPQIRGLYDALLGLETPTTREAVATALLVRSFTRINAHIGNATSGVIFPLENIDFVTRGLRQERQ